MYQKLASFHPELSNFKVFEGYGHAEFTYLGHCMMLETIMQILIPPSRRVSSSTLNLDIDITKFE